jgi:acetoin utilization deacetylase AcuC-like enzyme
VLLLSSHPELDHHDTGGRHPERPGRVPAALGGIDDAGLRDAVVALAPRRASTEELVRVHPER